uniref:Transmembrane protein 230 n=1 Tax=Lygus hesperus TaxID=30085 RepID=A0A0A9X246_LYGHE
MVPPRDYGSIKYRKLSQRKEDSFDERQFEQKPPRIPWKAIIFAFILFIVGSGLLIMALLISAGLMENVKYEDRSLSLMILGFLMFLPGAYHVRIAYHALRGHPSYSFDDIPEFQ